MFYKINLQAPVQVKQTKDLLYIYKYIYQLK